MSSKKTDTTPETRPSPETLEKPGADKKPRRQPKYNVILLDDDDHTYDYVVEMLRKVFGYQAEKGLLLAKEVDTQKRVVLLTTHLEHAELKQEQIHGYGPDKQIAGCKGGMTSVLEPVPE